MTNEEFCRALMAADTEDEVVELLRSLGYWEDPKVWRYIGDSDTNWSTIGNQQGDSIAALVEKVVNAIDSYLMNVCLRERIDPKGPNAPQSIREAVARFVENAPNPHADHTGRLYNWLDTDIRKVARQITLAATQGQESESNPSLSIADTGEGQTPDGIPNTFMSLNRRNKIDIPFVQGKYNMGGTGALYFCGERKLQLLVTRRNPSLVSHTGRDSEWGFTVTRREATGERASVFTYLAPVDADSAHRRGSVLSFGRQRMPLLPEASEGLRSAYAREVEYGSLIKLYEYDFSPRSNIVFTRKGLRQKLESHLPELPLPVGVFECRKRFRGKPGSYFTPARGTATRLQQDKNTDKLEFPPLVARLKLDGANIDATVYAFKRTPSGTSRDGFLAEYAQGAGVLYTVNGQTHTQVSNAFFTRKAVGLNYLKDDLLVTVNCSSVDEITREDLFMNSRDRNRVTPKWKELESKIERLLKDEPKLKDLSLQRRQEMIREKTQEDQPLTDLLSLVIEAAPDLARVLLGGERLPAPFPKHGTGSASRAKRFVGKQFPTYFHFDNHKSNDDYVRTAELGRDLRVTFQTDAQDDYFVRTTDRGYMRAIVDDGRSTQEIVDDSLRLADGLARWTTKLPLDASVGDQLTYDFEVTDPFRNDAFKSRLILEVTALRDRFSSGTGKRSRKNEGKGAHSAESGLSLPHVTEVRREDNNWERLDFTEQSALAIYAKPEEDDESVGYDFFYNADNESLLRAQKAVPEDAELIRERFRCSIVLVGLALIRDHTQVSPDSAHSDEGNLQELVAMATRALAPVMLPLVEFVAALSVTSEK